MTTNEGITLQLSGRSGLLAAVPALLGFHPQESLVLMCLSGPRRQLGPVLRVDLPTPAHPWDDHDYSLLRYHARSNAEEVALLWYTDEPLPPPAYDLLALIEADGTAVLDATVVRSDDHQAPERLDNPDNRDDSEDADDPQAAMVSAVFALHGRRVLRDREAIRRSIAAPTGPGALAARAASRQAAELLAHRPDGSGQLGAAGFGQWAAGLIDAALCAVTDGTPLSAGTAATIALLLVDPAVRDHCIGRVLDEPEAQWLPLLIAVATARWTWTRRRCVRCWRWPRIGEATARWRTSQSTAACLPSLITSSPA